MQLKIKELRKEKKLSQEELASKIDVSVRMFSEYENEKMDIPLRKLQRIADVLNVRLFDLITEEPVKKQSGSNLNKISITGNDNTLYKDELLAQLKQENADLRVDKQLLLRIIEVKL